ncbi:uncharacterized protein LOC101235893 [Hydra vulgaris]|uniref:uncharacterized protein LOC101235893 n=1 Tax=Hydra vulgaris TaxID=6087 RepID=UPI00064118FC|nr:uncharacterized protein LOC101235893 [Hydra vulgaris]XP_047128013.1 uncharacterized protein LOC101235893 [Hydra vulgaris]XP_047128014.1 uncharacterized protein LOC101235893 [Hydra vulgaris]
MLVNLFFLSAIMCLMKTSFQNDETTIQINKPEVLLDPSLQDRTKSKLKISIKNDLLYKNITTPSYTTTVFLYSKLGYYLTINESGNIMGTLDTKSRDIFFEVESYGVYFKRFRKPNSWYIAIDKLGIIKTRKQGRKDTLFRVMYNDAGWAYFQNDATGFVLGLQQNGKPKNKIANVTLRNRKKTHFLILTRPVLQPLSTIR